MRVCEGRIAHLCGVPHYTTTPIAPPPEEGVSRALHRRQSGVNASSPRRATRMSGVRHPPMCGVSVNEPLRGRVAFNPPAGDLVCGRGVSPRQYWRWEAGTARARLGGAWLPTSRFIYSWQLSGSVVASASMCELLARELANSRLPCKMIIIRSEE